MDFPDRMAGAFDLNEPCGFLTDSSDALERDTGVVGVGFLPQLPVGQVQDRDLGVSFASVFAGRWDGWRVSERERGFAGALVRGLNERVRFRFRFP